MNAPALDSAALMREATAATGLSDFGDPSFRTGLDRLVASVNHDSRLSEIGEAGMHGALVAPLRNRLQVEDWYRRHPEIEDEVIVAPVVITGLPRTGSTALGHMTALDPQTRSLRGWEATAPCPPPDLAHALDDPRIAEHAAQEAWTEGLAPGIRDALPRDPSAPEECLPLLQLTYASAGMDAFAHVPSYIAWLEQDGTAALDAAYRYHRRVLKLLQWRHPAKRWILRSPTHAKAMPSLLAVYPDARFVWTHRAPEKVLPSVANLMHQVRRAFLAEPEPVELGRLLVDNWATALHRLIACRDQIGEDRFYDIAHRDQIADPIATVRSLYRWLGWDFAEADAQRIEQWRAGNPRGDHRPDPNIFGIDPAAVRQRFAFYTSRFAAYL